MSRIRTDCFPDEIPRASDFETYKPPPRVPRPRRRGDPAPQEEGALTWEEPPPRKTNRGTSRYFDLLNVVMQRPGEWAKVFEGSRSRAYSFAGHLRAIIRANPRMFGKLESEWELASRCDKGDETGATYIRYLPL